MALSPGCREPFVGVGLLLHQYVQLMSLVELVLALLVQESAPLARDSAPLARVCALLAQGSAPSAWNSALLALFRRGKCFAGVR